MKLAYRAYLKLICFLGILCGHQVICDDHGSSPTPTVRLKNGDTVEGLHVSTMSGATGRVFLGIPFAQPPLGHLRFKKPIPLEGSNTTFSCLAYKSNCWQNHTHVRDPVTDLSEDCLFVNVFGGYACREGSKCPVLYYIHGGGFEFDAPSMFPVDVLVENFATHGLVMVTVAYRLGVMGFWSLGSDEAVGNYAFHDAIEGLKWVQKEIEVFGGDKDRVTIMGHSAGAAFVSLLTLTSKTEGLFNRAVIMSGSPMLSTDLAAYHRLAEDVGCARKTDWHSDHQYDNKIVECMQRVPIDILINTYSGYEVEGFTAHTMPLIDGPLGIFPSSLSDLIQKRRPVDSMIGTTKNEYGFNKLKEVNATAASLASLCKSTMDEKLVNKNKHLLTFQCQRHYVGGALDDLKYKNQSQANEKYSVWTEKTVDLRNDVQYFAPVFQEATSLANAGGEVYLYSFDYVKTGLEGLAPWHAFDLTYVTGIHPFDYDDRDYAIKSIYVPLFANFAKFGNPTPNEDRGSGKWIPLLVPPINMNYLSIDLPQATMKNGYHYEGVLFWDYVVPNVGVSEKRAPKFVRLQANVTSVQSDQTDWKSAFWITLIIAILVIVSLGLSVLVINMKGRSWTCRCSCLRRRQNRENETLLGSMKHADSYATFY